MGRYATDDDLQAADGWVDEDAQPTATESDPEPEPDEPDQGEGEEVGQEPDGQDEEAGDDEPDAGEDDQGIELTLNGEAVTLTRKEIEAGVLRQADYTRKTQQLAAERRSLGQANDILQALDNNPAETLAIMAQHYKVPWGGDPYAEPPEPPSQEQIALRDMQAWREQQELQQRAWQVDNEVRRLHEQYGEFDDDELFTFAVSSSVPDLETALRAMVYDRSPRANGKRTEKRKVAGVAGGQGRSTAVAPRTLPEKITRFSDAYDAAKRELENRE